MRVKMDISEKQMKIMKALEEVSTRLGMKANKIATELYGPPSGCRKRLRDGNELSRAIAKLSENDLIEDVSDNAPSRPARWILTDKGRNHLEGMKD